MADVDIHAEVDQEQETVKLSPAGIAKTRLITRPAGLPARIPVRMGSYAIEGLIGRGAMGVVYKARQDGLNRVVALKVLVEGGNASGSMRHRFLREAKAMAKLRHPGIVAIYEVGECEGQPFFTMEYVDGARMDVVMKHWKIVSSAILADLMARIAEAVHYAHEQGIVHRDLKPANILIDSKANPIVTDFGLAKDLDADSMLSMSGDILGTPAYMSPEQAGGRVSEAGPRSDVYSLGAILYWVLTRHEPYEGRTLMETLHSVVHDEPPMIKKLNPGIEPELCAICLKAMEKNPEARYASAHDLAMDLRRFINGYVVEATPWTWRRASARFVRRHRRGVMVAILVAWAIVLTAVGAALIFHRSYLDIAHRQLASADAEVRAETVVLLGRELVAPALLKADQIPRAVGLLMSAHRDPDPKVRGLLLAFLAEHAGLAPVAAAVSDPVAAWLVAEASDASSPARRNQAIRTLGLIPRPEFTRFLIEQLRDPNPLLRLPVIRVLGDRGDIEVLSPLLGLMAEDYVCRPEIEAAVQRIYASQSRSAKKTDARLADNAMGRLTSVLATHMDQMDVAGKDAQVEDRNPFAGFERSLLSGDPAARIRAAYELGRSGATEALPILVRALGDRDPAVGPAIAMALARLDCAGLEATLIAGLKGADPAMRLNSALALGFCRKADVLDSLLVALATEADVNVKRGMIRALGELGASRAAPGLRRASETDPRLAADVDAALRRLPAPAMQ